MVQYLSGNPIPNPSNTWSNDPVVADATAVRKVHLQELREALEDHSVHLHTFDGYTSTTELPNVSFTWTVPLVNIIPNVTKLSAGHWTELRTAVESSDMHYHNVPDLALDSSTLDLQVPGTWSAGLAAGEKPLKTHIDELRYSIGLMHNHTHTACCDSECSCECTCTCTCTENCCSQCWWFDQENYEENRF